MPFLQSPVLEVIIRCSITAVSLDHREANASVMKFLLDLLICGKSKKVTTFLSRFLLTIYQTKYLF